MVILETRAPRRGTNERAKRRRNVNEEIAHQEENRNKGRDALNLGDDDKNCRDEPWK